MNNTIDLIMEDLRCTTSYKRRLSALRNSVKNYNLNDEKWRSLKDKTIDLALHDKVFSVKEEAFRICQKNNLKKNGKSIFLGKKDIGFKPKDIQKLFLRIKRETKMEELNLDLFKKTFIILKPEMFDVMSYEKNNKFDEWIEKLYKTLPKS